MFDSPGKQAFRSLLLELAKRDELKTYGTLWGTGIDSRLFADAGFDVTAAEVERAKHDAMREDARAHAYKAFCGNAKRLNQRFDMFHADFCGTASPRNFEVLRVISEKVDRWLAVTLSPDHQLDPSMQGEAAFGTVPAWLVWASPSFSLQYLGRYRRNDSGQWMWFALLERLDKELSAPVHDLAASVRDLGYWAPRRMTDHTPRTLLRLPLTCTECGNPTMSTDPRSKYCSRRCLKRAEYLRRKRKDGSLFDGSTHPTHEQRSCRHCGAIIRADRKRGTKYCDQKCAHAHWVSAHPGYWRRAS